MSLALASAEYLWKLAKLQLNPALKSNYYVRLEEKCETNNLDLLTKCSKNKGRCPKCLIEYNRRKAPHKILPQQKLSRFAQKILHKRDLTKFQAKYLKKLKPNYNTNSLEIICTYCNEKLNARLKKPIKQKIQEDIITPVKHKPKKQNRDKFCGLNKEVVMSLKSQPSHGKGVPANMPQPNTVNGQSMRLTQNQMKKKEAVNKKKLKRLQNIIKKDDKKAGGGGAQKGKNQSSYNQNVKGLQNFLSMLR